MHVTSDSQLLVNCTSGTVKNCDGTMRLSMLLCSNVGNCYRSPIKSFEHATAAVYRTVLFCEWFMTVCTYSVLLSCIFSMLLEDILLSLAESSIG